MHVVMQVCTSGHIMGELLAPPTYSKRIIAVSFLSLGAAAFAVSRGVYDIMAVPLVVFTTSINYWRHPVRGWRRNTDIAVVTVCIAYQMYRAQECKHRFKVYITLALGAPCSAISWAFEHYNNQHMSSLFHCGIHILGNIALVLLVIGL